MAINDSFKFNEISMIQRPTRFAQKFLVTISSATIFVEQFQVPLEDLSILGVNAPTAFWGVVAIALIAFGLIDLLVNYVGDYLLYRSKSQFEHYKDILESFASQVDGILSDDSSAANQKSKPTVDTVIKLHEVSAEWYGKWHAEELTPVSYAAAINGGYASMQSALHECYA